jgi:hypothetical protein
MVSRTLTLFVRYSSLIRPLGEHGKLRLTGDMAQLELSLAPLMPQVHSFITLIQKLTNFFHPPFEL